MFTMIIHEYYQCFSQGHVVRGQGLDPQYQIINANLRPGTWHESKDPGSQNTS